MWSSSEYNSNNAVNVNSGGNVNNNNKNNQFGVVPVLEMPVRPSLNLRSSYDYRSVLDAYLDCRQRKRNKNSAIAFEVDFERNIDNLTLEINSRRYTIGRSNVFVVTHPKPREVWAAGFRDRIVHHLIYRDIGPWYEAGFIEDSYSCIKGRGTLAATHRAERFARSVTRSWTTPAWALQVDVANFFVSINKQKLWDTLRASVGCDSLTAHLIKQVVFHDPTQNARAGTPALAGLVPSHKSLWTCPAGCGLPIGNLTSQFFSNVYLDGMDKFAKHSLGIKYYARYVDDVLILSRDRQRLVEWRNRIDRWLRLERGLRLHEKKTRIAPVADGINFVGAVVLPWRTYPRRSTVHSAKQAFVHANQSRTPSSVESAQSYLGMIRHGSSFRVRRKLCTSLDPRFFGHNAEMTKTVLL